MGAGSELFVRLRSGAAGASLSRFDVSGCRGLPLHSPASDLTIGRSGVGVPNPVFARVKKSALSHSRGT